MLHTTQAPAAAALHRGRDIPAARDRIAEQNMPPFYQITPPASHPSKVILRRQEGRGGSQATFRPHRSPISHCIPLTDARPAQQHDSTQITRIFWRRGLHADLIVSVSKSGFRTKSGSNPLHCSKRAPNPNQNQKKKKERKN